MPLHYSILRILKEMVLHHSTPRLSTTPLVTVPPLNPPNLLFYYPRAAKVRFIPTSSWILEAKNAPPPSPSLRKMDKVVRSSCTRRLDGIVSSVESGAHLRWL